MLSVTVQLRDLANNPRAIRNETSIDNIVLCPSSKVVRVDFIGFVLAAS